MVDVKNSELVYRFSNNCKNFEKTIKSKKWDKFFELLKNTVNANATLDDEVEIDLTIDYIWELFEKYDIPYFIEYSFRMIVPYLYKIDFDKFHLEKFDLQMSKKDVYIKMFIIFVEVRRNFYKYLFKYFEKRFNKEFITNDEIKKAETIIDDFLECISIKHFGDSRAYSNNTIDSEFIEDCRKLIIRRDCRLISKHNLEYTFIENLLGITKETIKEDSLPEPKLLNNPDFNTLSKLRIKSMIYNDFISHCNRNMDTDLHVYYEVKKMFDVEESNDNHLYMNLENEDIIYDKLYNELFPEHEKNDIEPTNRLDNEIKLYNNSDYIKGLICGAIIVGFVFLIIYLFFYSY